MASNVDDDTLALLGLALILKINNTKKKRKKWCKHCLLKTKTYSHVNLLNKLKFKPDLKETLENNWRDLRRRPEYTHTRTGTPYCVSPYGTRKNRFSILRRLPAQVQKTAQVYSHTHSGLPAQAYLHRWTFPVDRSVYGRLNAPNVA